jgi:hypothetical protein
MRPGRTGIRSDEVMTTGWIDRHGTPWPPVFASPAVTGRTLGEVAHGLARNYALSCCVFPAPDELARAPTLEQLTAALRAGQRES